MHTHDATPARKADMDKNVKKAEQKILDTLRIDFIGSASQKLIELQALVLSLPRSASGAGWTGFLEEIHVLKGMGGTFGFQNFTQVARRLEQYFENQGEAGDIRIDDVQMFLTKMNDCLELGAHADQTQIDAVLASLPDQPIAQ